MAVKNKKKVTRKGVVGGKSEASGEDVRTDTQSRAGEQSRADAQIQVVYGRKLPEGEVVDGILRLRGEGIPLRMICGRYGISRTRMDRWMSQGEEDVDEGKDTPCSRLYVGMAKAETAVAERCMGGILKAGEADGGRNWAALAWIMERCFPEEYGLARRADVGEKEASVRVVMGGQGGSVPHEPGRVMGVVDARVEEHTVSESPSGESGDDSDDSHTDGSGE
nr:MAG TPA: putative terminase small subunit [Caudoviricetes sp.]